jgi:cytochrome c-type biogenesis protein CcmH
VRKIFIFLILFVNVVFANTIELYKFDDKSSEMLYKKMIKELRCLVCQNQNLADSNADLAIDLRAKTYKLVSENKNEKEIIKWMTDKYGDFVLYKPQLNKKTYVLWFAPFILGFIAIGFLFYFIKKQKNKKHKNDEDLQKVRELLK